MFLKTALTFLVVGVLSVNALTAPVPRSPAPEPEGEFTRSLSTISYHGLTFVPSTAQQLEARLFWDRDLELLPRGPPGGTPARPQPARKDSGVVTIRMKEVDPATRPDAFRMDYPKYPKTKPS